MITKEVSIYIINFMTPRAGVHVLERGHVSYIVKMHNSFKKFFSTLRDGSDKHTHTKRFDDVHIDSFCINKLYCIFPLPLLIFIYSMMGPLIWQEVSVQSLIRVVQVTVKTNGPLVSFDIGSPYLAHGSMTIRWCVSNIHEPDTTLDLWPQGKIERVFDMSVSGQ